MPSLRNPVGPLPASIYWRRRLVVLAAFAAVVALLSWLVFGGGGGKSPVASASGSPAGSLTPGGGSNDGKPGGSSASSAPATGGATSGGTGTPSGGASPSASASASAGAPVSVSGGSTGSSGRGSTQGNAPGVANLPQCAAADLELALNSTEQNYNSSQWPMFKLDVTNTGGAACRIDLGAKSAVLTITSDSGTRVWSSGDCPKDGSAQWFAVPASGGPLTATFQWARTTSQPGCTPGAGGGAVAAGTYLARVAVSGLQSQPTHQFKLAPFGS